MDAQLQFKVTNQMIERTDEFKVVAKSVDYLYAQFTFETEEWENITPVAIFRYFDDVYKVYLDENNTCVVPWEVLQHEGQYFLVSAFSNAGNLITANSEKVFVNSSGYEDDEPTTRKPTPTIYENILTRVKNIENATIGNIDGGLFTDWREE